jgi:hypothetical protein
MTAQNTGIESIAASMMITATRSRIGDECGSAISGDDQTSAGANHQQ